MKRNVLITVFVVVDAAVIVLSLLLMLAGHYAWGGVALLAAFAAVWVAARFWANSPEPVPAEPFTDWRVWDEELEDGMSDVERQMLRYGYVRLPDDPVDVHQAQMARALNENSGR